MLSSHLLSFCVTSPESHLLPFLVRLPHPHTLIIPVIALHPPSPEELDPTSIPVIARANKVLQASYRSHDDPSSTEVPDRSTQGRVDSPSAARSKDASPRRSGRSSRRGSGERRTPELPPIIETPLGEFAMLLALIIDITSLAFLIYSGHYRSALFNLDRLTLIVL